MTASSPVFPPGYPLIMVIGALLFLLLHGCAQKPVIPLEEIPDRVWLPVSNENHVMDGFFTGADG
ncbi:MAG: hypothetical protein ACSLFH_08745, partial [Desulfuromonadales bacterium]